MIARLLRSFARLCFLAAGLWFAFDLIALVSMWAALALALGVAAYCLPEFWTQEAEQDG